MVAVELGAAAVTGKLEAVLAVFVDAEESVLGKFLVDELAAVVLRAD